MQLESGKRIFHCRLRSWLPKQALLALPAVRLELRVRFSKLPVLSGTSLLGVLNTRKPLAPGREAFCVQAKGKPRRNAATVLLGEGAVNSR